MVTGKVQGVFFRASAMAEAQRLGLAGFVKNLPDGAVEAVAQGPESAVEQFIAWCKVGPPSARVDELKVRFVQPGDEFRTFVISR